MSKSQIRKSSVLALLALSAALAGCANGVSLQGSTSGDDESGKIASGLYDHSANQASAGIAYDAASKSSGVSLESYSDANEPGTYNGDGKGNRALLGLKSFDGTKLSKLTGISFEAKSLSGAGGVSLLLSIDLACDNRDVRVVSAEASSLTQSSALSGSAFRRYTASFSKLIWKATEQPLLDPKDSTQALLTTGSELSSLNGIIANYPSACLRNGLRAESELPKGRSLASIILSLGSATKPSEGAALITRISLDSAVDEDVEFDSSSN